MKRRIVDYMIFPQLDEKCNLSELRFTAILCSLDLVVSYIF